MKIIGMMVCGQGEADRYLEKPLQQFKELCDDAIIACNGEDKKRDKLIKKYGFWSYRDDREWGLYQPHIKTALLGKIMRLKPDWVLPLDADEEIAGMDRPLLEKTINELPTGKKSCFFYFVTLWQDDKHFAPKFGFWNIRLFQPVPALGLQYQKTPLHCGLAPPYAYNPKHAKNLPMVVRHYGMMSQEDRDKKIERYEKYDPRQIYKNPIYYDWLKEDEEPKPYNEDSMIRKVTALSHEYD
jgi:hypothetical protein